jgi:regulator of replication initiation timing
MEQLSFAGDVVTKNELEDLKENINSSFEEVVSLILEQRRDLDMLLERLDKHNARASHKI